MNFAETFRFAWRGVTVNKGRSVLTMLGVFIGVSSVIILVAVGGGASAYISNTLSSLGANTITVSPGNSSSTTQGFGPGAGGGAGSGGSDAAAANGSDDGTDIRADKVTLEDARALTDKAQAPDILGVAPVVSASSVSATFQNATHTVSTTTGSTTTYLLISGDTVAQGHEFSDTDYTAHSRVALVGTTVAEDLAGGDGSAILDQTIGLNGSSFTVIGILTAKGSTGPQDQDDRVILPATALQDTLAGYQDLDSITVKATSASAVDAAQAEAERILDARHGTTAATRDFTVSNTTSLVSTVHTITTLFTYLLAAIAGISLLVGGIGVMNIMLVTVTERTREIGIRKAIGAGRSDIVIQFLLEAVMLSLFGGLLGVGFGSLSGLIHIKDYQPVVSGASVALALGFSVAVGLGFGLYPAYRAASLKPIDALRYE